MGEESKNTQQKQQSKPKKTSKNDKIDTPSLIFFGVMIIGIVVFIIIMIHNENKQKYVTNFGENISATIELKNKDDFYLVIDANDTKIEQTGKYELVNEKTNEYLVTFEDKTTNKFILDSENNQLTIYLDNNTLTLSKE